MNEKQKIDWLELFRKICASRRLLLKVCGIGAVVGLIIALSIPKEYTASTLVAHEGTRSRSFSDIRELANITPGMSGSIATDRDALFPSLYSTIVRSTPFLLQLSDVEVRRQKDSTAMPLARYLKEHQKTVVESCHFHTVATDRVVHILVQRETGDESYREKGRISPFTADP